jgi:hypothetical protein
VTGYHAFYQWLADYVENGFCPVILRKIAAGSLPGHPGAAVPDQGCRGSFFGELCWTKQKILTNLPRVAMGGGVMQSGWR